MFKIPSSRLRYLLYSLYLSMNITVFRAVIFSGGSLFTSAKIPSHGTRHFDASIWILFAQAVPALVHVG